MNFKQCYHENTKLPPAQYKVGPLTQTEINTSQIKLLELNGDLTNW